VSPLAPIFPEGAIVCKMRCPELAVLRAVQPSPLRGVGVLETRFSDALSIGNTGVMVGASPRAILREKGDLARLRISPATLS